ncbi:MAG: hypothetical protein RIC55_17070 [Pirellulaceae bacterium]
MCNVSKHPFFDAYLQEIELEHPELRAGDTVKALKWAIEHGVDLAEQYDEADNVYFVTTAGIQVFYDKRHPVGRPTEVLFRVVHVRPGLH